MGLTTKEKVLQFSFRIPRTLHDEVDEVRELAKSVGSAYDPHSALEKALRKDLASTRKQIDAMKKVNAAKASE